MERGALIIVDLQNDFCPGGALPVPGGHDIVSVVNALSLRFQEAGRPVIATQDWHPADHVSFQTRGGPWPVHCVQGTPGADLHPLLRREPITHLVRKAYRRDEEAYSGFQGTGLAELLRALGVEEVYVCGLAMDVCVNFTALDAARAGFRTTILEDATRPVFPEQLEEKRRAWQEAGVVVRRAQDLLGAPVGG
ncbi:MAG: isochorismatase family protein [Armatimonadota bacterium]|nr:isochorismatase family protein [Armatimonadota bacterium]MDR7442987.1 isochorismatase family protein [Armatimonadota bacterium]MDR7569409.1 isochorismatase family protein [Armatimonadota bacterium]MDR7614558.1 isochorismatase family protein [Armatimonadota bacterium]